MSIKNNNLIDIILLFFNNIYMKLKDLRKEWKLTQNEMANILNVAKSTYRGYEKGYIIPPLDTLIKMADYFGVSLDYLCEHKTCQLQLPVLNETKKELIEIILKLDNDNFNMSYGYIMGLFKKQNSKN